LESPFVEIRELTKTYGDFTAVSHLDLHILRGEMFALLGPNGAVGTLDDLRKRARAESSLEDVFFAVAGEADSATGSS
jgi:ABC-type uncharacterized transport system ATPase subunit